MTRPFPPVDIAYNTDHNQSVRSGYVSNTSTVIFSAPPERDVHTGPKIVHIPHTFLVNNTHCLLTLLPTPFLISFPGRS